MTNILLENWNTPFGLPPFSKISDDDFSPALDAALDQARSELAAIAGNPAPADFANTIVPLELMGGALDKVLGPFFALAGSASTPAREALQREFAPKLSAFWSEITMNPEFQGSHEFKVAAMNKTIAFPIDPWFHLGDPRILLACHSEPLSVNQADLPLPRSTT